MRCFLQLSAMPAHPKRRHLAGRVKGPCQDRMSSPSDCKITNEADKPMCSNMRRQPVRAKLLERVVRERIASHSHSFARGWARRSAAEFGSRESYGPDKRSAAIKERPSLTRVPGKALEGSANTAVAGPWMVPDCARRDICSLQALVEAFLTVRARENRGAAPGSLSIALLNTREDDRLKPPVSCPSSPRSLSCGDGWAGAS